MTAGGAGLTPSGRRPARAPLRGPYATLAPLDPRAHGDALYAASHGDRRREALWTFMAYGPFADGAAFGDWLDLRAASGDPLFFAVLDAATGSAVGMASFCAIRPDMGVVEVGHIWYGPAAQRTAIPTAAMAAMFGHVFDDLGYRRLEWKCDALNTASRRAALRLGFVHEGEFRQHMIVKGRNRDTSWFAMLDADWPRVRAAMARWLAPENFDAQGRQRKRLQAAAPVDGGAP